MTIELNDRGLRHARALIRSHQIVRDERDDWSEHAPSADDENTFLDAHGIDDYATWHLGVDPDASEGTKGRYSFPFGDFRRVHRCAVISLESRAAQFDHAEIAAAAKSLLEALDA